MSVRQAGSHRLATVFNGIVGFFPPASVRIGEWPLFFSLAHALSLERGAAAALMPERSMYPSFLGNTPVFDLKSSWELKGGYPLKGAVVFTYQSDFPVYRSLPDLFAAFPHTLLFLEPEDFSQQLNPALAAHTRCLVGVSPTVADVAQAKRLAGRLLAFGIPRENIDMVLWNEGLPEGIPPTMLVKNLGPFRCRLPFEPAVFARAQNDGCFLHRLRCPSALQQAIAVWARESSRPLEALTPSAKNSPVNWPELEKTLASRLWRSFQSADGAGSSPNDIARQLDQEIHSLPGLRAAAAESEWARLRQNVLDHVTGLGPLEKFFRDSSINEIMVNGLDGIFIERDGLLEKAAAAFDSREQLRTVIDRIVGRMGRRVDASSPLCDVRLPDGSRVNVVLPPLSLCGPALTIRRFKALYRSLDDLIGAGTLTPVQAEKLIVAVRERQNIVVAGNSGAGKTTLLNVLAAHIPDRERIVTLEDAAELQIDKPHVVRLETRPKNSEGVGQILMSELLVNALRMRPDRLIIGECRGAEAIPMLQAMNTGHDGSMTTLHANSAADALKRLESMILLGAPGWSVEVVREQIAAGVDMVVYLRRSGAERKLLEIVDV